MKNQIPVAILGATGSVGQRFVQLLDGHPWFKVVALTGSERTAGKVYKDACRWVLPEAIPDWARTLTLRPSDPAAFSAALVFSALPSRAAREIEPAFAAAGTLVCSNASAYREAADVPLLLPEVNPDHTGLLAAQRAGRGWRGGIVTNPNCTSTGMTIALKALQDQFGLRRVMAVSLQAISGAGYPGLAALDMLDNVIPYIAGEEEKVAWEPRKMLGRLAGGQIELAETVFSVQVNRVAVSDGHLVNLAVELDQPATPAEAVEALTRYEAPAISRDLPHTPRPVITVRAEPDRPQPRLDRCAGGGMTTVVGRVRPDAIFHLKMVVLSHNTIRGAAGGSIYNAELLVKQNLLP